MSTAAVLLGHGSPDPAGRAELGELRALVGRRLGLDVGLGVLEFPGPGLPAVDQAFAAAGARIAAQPLILFDGLHGRHDLPAAAAGATARLGVEVRLGAALGRDPALIELCAGRAADLRPAPGDLLLFVGRGSSEPLARAQTEQVAAAVAGALGVDHTVCYTGISPPSLAVGIALALSRRPRRILALPYLLHTGVLVRRVGEVLGPAAAGHGVPLDVLPHLGNAPQVVDLVASRLEALLR